MDQKEPVRDIARSMNLRPATVKDLLDSGWTYISDMNGPSRWLDPSHNFKV